MKVPVYRIPVEEMVFPHPELSEPSGLLGVGGDLQPERLLLAYSNGIFPWYSEGQPILWFSPDPRCVLEPSQLYVGRSLRKVVRNGSFRVSLDTAFEQVIGACKSTPRPGQEGTWITDEMRQAYCQLHALGHAHSVEVWLDEELVGGLYGVAIGRLFAGESMFSHASNASKVGLVWLVRQLATWDFALVDAQIHTETLERLGAQEILRSDYLECISALVRVPGRVGQWRFDDNFHPFGD